MEWVKVVLQFLQIIVWPGALLAFLFMFRSQIGAFIHNIVSIKGPAGLEIQQQPVKTIRKSTLDPANSTKATAKDLREEVRYWEFTYLDMFLVWNSKRVLVSMLRLGESIGRPRFHIMWAPHISQDGEREAILSVLLVHGLLSEQAGMLAITDKGKDYIAFANLENRFPLSEFVAK